MLEWFIVKLFIMLNYKPSEVKQFFNCFKFLGVKRYQSIYLNLVVYLLSFYEILIKDKCVES